jgi:hypothetical protein
MKTIQSFEPEWSESDEAAVAAAIDASGRAGGGAATASAATHPPLTTPLLAWSVDELKALAVADGQVRERERGGRRCRKRHTLRRRRARPLP